MSKLSFKEFQCLLLLLSHLSFLLFFLLRRHFHQKIDSKARYLIRDPRLCVALGRLLILERFGPQQASEDNTIY